MKMKLNVLLAKTDHLASVYKKGLKDYAQFFTKSQGSFKGEKRTYVPKVGTIDMPKERANKKVVSTVDEKLKWFEEQSSSYIDALFSQEKTNATGLAKAKLEVEGKVWGEFTSLELLRLKGLLESDTLRQMYENIPVRNDDEEWNASDNEMYEGRTIYESNKVEGSYKTTQKTSYILPDPNVAKGGDYTPQVATKDAVMELGDYTFQKFSGEMSHRERAVVLSRRTNLLSAVIEALKIANEAVVVPSEMTSEKLFSYLHGK